MRSGGTPALRTTSGFARVFRQPPDGRVARRKSQDRIVDDARLLFGPGGARIRQAIRQANNVDVGPPTTLLEQELIAEYVREHLDARIACQFTDRDNGASVRVADASRNIDFLVAEQPDRMSAFDE